MMAATDDDHTIHNLVQSVFTEILAEFRDWKIKYSEHILRSLSLGKRVPLVPVPILDSGSIGGDFHLDAGEEQRAVTMTTYSEDGTESMSTTRISLQVIHAEAFEPHAPYESYSPIPRNVFKGDDDDRMAFIPFADDATFDHADHMLCYGSLAWQEDYDPDCEYLPDLRG
jgi:histone-lysine N-methyltransferase EZH2